MTSVVLDLINIFPVADLYLVIYYSSQHLVFKMPAP